MNYWNFFKSKGQNSAKNCSTGTKFELDLRILVTHLYTEFQLKMSINNRDNERKLWIIEIFPSPRGITLSKIIRPEPNLNLTCVFLWHIYILNFNWKCSRMTEIMSGNWIIGIFLSPRGITLPKIIRPEPNSNLTCVFSWHIYILNFNWKCQFVMEIISGNLNLLDFFKVQGPKLCRKLFNRNQIQTQPAYSQDTSLYQISIQNVILCWR